MGGMLGLIHGFVVVEVVEVVMDDLTVAVVVGVWGVRAGAGFGVEGGIWLMLVGALGGVGLGGGGQT